jgi:hypothetical protein
MGALAAIGGALIQRKSAGDAADAQRRSAVADRAYQEQTRDLIFDRLDPFYQGGTNAQRALDFELGLAARPTFGGTPMAVESFYEAGAPGPAGGGFNGSTLMQGLGLGARGASNALASGMGGQGVQRFRVGGQTFNTREEAEAFARQNGTGGMAYGGFTKTPGYDFRMQQGLGALEASAAARGGLYSGAAMQDSLKFGQDYASSEYQNYLAQLSNRAGTGMGAATGIANAATNTAGGVSNALASSGNAAAAGAVGSGNALVGGLQNLSTLWNYQRNMGGQQGGGGVNGNGAWANSIFGGKGLGGFV